MHVIQSEKKSLSLSPVFSSHPVPVPVQMTSGCFLAAAGCLYVVVCMLEIILFGSLVLTLLLLL